jgi:hypothetical protein
VCQTLLLGLVHQHIMLKLRTDFVQVSSGLQLTIVGVVPNPTASDQTVCSNGSNTQTLTATATGNTITWYSAATGGSIVSSPTQVGVDLLTMQSHLLKLYK